VTGKFKTDKSMHSLLVLSRIQALDELCESTCWSQLGCHARPIGLLNVNGFFAGFVKQVERGVSAGFIHEAYGRMHTAAEEPNQVCSNG
jgi:predicted Rossmann-fold nucleotide-binding protein